LRAKFKV
jgi:hypothetical protein